jgi:hypothetical protein
MNRSSREARRNGEGRLKDVQAQDQLALLVGIQFDSEQAPGPALAQEGLGH